MQSVLKTAYWIDGLFLAAPLPMSTHDHFKRFWASYEPLPPELKRERTVWRTDADRLYTLEYRADWNSSAIHEMIRGTVESPHGHFFSYFRLIPREIVEIAPIAFHDRIARFTQLCQLGVEIPTYSSDFNFLLKKQFEAYLQGTVEDTPPELLRHEYAVISDCVTRADMTCERSP